MIKKQHIFTLLLYICIKNVGKHVKFEHLSWNSHPSPGTRLCLNFILIKSRHHTCRSYYFSKVKRRLETRINKIFTKYDYKLTVSWKQEITCMAACLFVKKMLHFIHLSRKDQFSISVMVVFKYVWEMTQGNCHKFHNIRLKCSN